MKSQYRTYLRTTPLISGGLKKENSMHSRNSTQTTGSLSTTQRMHSKKTSSSGIKSMFSPETNRKQYKTRNIQSLENFQNTHRNFLREKYRINKIRNKLSPLSMQQFPSFSFNAEDNQTIEKKRFNSIDIKIYETLATKYREKNLFSYQTNKIRVIKTLIDVQKNELLLNKEDQDNEINTITKEEHSLSNQYKLLKTVIIPVTDAYLKHLQKVERKEQEAVKLLKYEKDKLRKEINKMELKIEKAKQALKKEIQCRNLMVKVKEKTIELPSSFSPDKIHPTYDNPPNIYISRTSSPVKRHVNKSFARLSSISFARSSIVNKKTPQNLFIKKQTSQNINYSNDHTNDKFNKYLNIKYEIFPSVQSFLSNFEVLQNEIIQYTSIYIAKRIEIRQLRTYIEQTKKEGNGVINSTIKDYESKIELLKKQFTKNEQILASLNNSNQSNSEALKFKYDKVFNSIIPIVVNLEEVAPKLKDDITLQKTIEKQNIQRKMIPSIEILLKAAEKGLMELTNRFNIYKQNPTNIVFIKELKAKITTKRRVENAKMQRKLLEIQKEELLTKIINKKDKIYLLDKRKVSVPKENKKVTNKGRNKKLLELSKINVNYDFLTYNDNET